MTKETKTSKDVQMMSQLAMDGIADTEQEMRKVARSAYSRITPGCERLGPARDCHAKAPESCHTGHTAHCDWPKIGL